jgi:hypothetical protein
MARATGKYDRFERFLKKSGHVLRRVWPAPDAGGARGGGIGSLFGRMRGRIRLEPGYDFTQPPDPGLASYLDEKYGPEERHRSPR